jgi:hypothetical protein
MLQWNPRLIALLTALALVAIAILNAIEAFELDGLSW